MMLFLRQLLGYGLASVAALAVDAGMLWILHVTFGLAVVAAATISFLAGGVAAYQLSIRLAFREHRLEDRRVELLVFVGIGALTLLVNVAVMSAMVDHWHMPLLSAKAIAAVCTFGCNFSLRRQTLFVRRAEH